MDTIMVFDIETVPDIEAGRRLYRLQGLSDAAVAKVMYQARYQATDGQSDFLKLHLHQVIAISVVWRSFDGSDAALNKGLKVMSLEAPDASEKMLLERFFAGVTKYTPILVSWNGGRFDLPVLHYRALKHGVVCPRYWEIGETDAKFKWNNYLSRYHQRHTDLMDMLAGYQLGTTVALDELAVLLGFPGKMGMHGDKVWSYFQRGEIQAIRHYCETDVLNTYLVYLRYLLISGRFTRGQYQQEIQMVRDLLAAQASPEKPHFQEFLQAWPGEE